MKPQHKHIISLIQSNYTSTVKIKINITIQRLQLEVKYLIRYLNDSISKSHIPIQYNPMASKSHMLSPSHSSSNQVDQTALISLQSSPNHQIHVLSPRTPVSLSQSYIAHSQTQMFSLSLSISNLLSSLAQTQTLSVSLISSPIPYEIFINHHSSSVFNLLSLKALIFDLLTNEQTTLSNSQFSLCLSYSKVQTLASHYKFLFFTPSRHHQQPLLSLSPIIWVEPRVCVLLFSPFFFFLIFFLKVSR